MTLPGDMWSFCPRFSPIPDNFPMPRGLHPADAPGQSRPKSFLPRPPPPIDSCPSLRASSRGLTIAASGVPLGVCTGRHTYLGTYP
ncbi:hypothetical protein LX36DRAFT_64860 [Colletotrichum falcatum]|nr:hypothetical protein LX36DRAFT_64860 [Colletotrichum falcatum]